jgi:hydroxymethylpyrimidine/phosphomethylpyrimidine kinase
MTTEIFTVIDVRPFNKGNGTPVNKVRVVNRASASLSAQPSSNLPAMGKSSRLTVALTIAGSDSGGGAGIQADLKTFAALGVHGASVITCVTAQNPRRVLGVQALSPLLVRQQLEAVCSELPPAAIKTGMLYSKEIIRAVASGLRIRRRRGVPLIVDPVMVATSGARLLEPSAQRDLCDRLLPLATLVTPNLDEAALLLGRNIRDAEKLPQAARDIFERFGCAALVKGGHLRGRQAVDVFYDGQTELILAAPFVRGVSTHGTGCTYAAAIAALCARGKDLPTAVRLAKEFVTEAIARSKRAAKHWVLGWFW